jgi:hypothetical protein
MIQINEFRQLKGESLPFTSQSKKAHKNGVHWLFLSFFLLQKKK